MQDHLLGADVRSELETDNTLNYRIRQAQVQKVPYMLVMGDREMESGQVAIRLRSGENLAAQSLDDAVAMIEDKIASRALI